MEKLKSYLSALIEAAFAKKKAFIASQAVPNYVESAATEISVTSGQNVVAPYDSVVSARTTLGEPNLKVSCNVNGKLISSMYGINTGTNIATAFPIKKGGQINLAPATDSEARAMSLCFFKLVGGGYLKSILQSGGDLCLRLKNTLKLSHKVLACQSLTQPFFSKHPQSTTGLIHISHLQTERYTCMSPVVQGSTSPIHQQRLCKQLSSVMPVTLRSTQHFVSEQKKATQSLFTTPVLKQVRTFVAGLFPTQALNFAQGGAL